MATILDSVVGLCIRKLKEKILEEAVLMLGAYDELTELQRRMTQIQYFLSDAERRSIEDLAVNNWLGELKDAVYDADDIIDLAKYEGKKLLMDRPSSSLAPRNSTRCSDLSLLSCFRNIQTRHEIAIQIRNLNTKLEKISRDKTFLTLDNVKPEGKASIKNQRKTSHLVEPNLVGKEIKAATARLVELILENKENKAYKLAIVGIGGVGKTTLAQNIYNHQRIKGNFSKHAWICVSQEYSEITLMKEVLRNIGVHEQQGETIGELQSKLASSIENESFFAVLDDVWQPDVWTNLLRTPLYAAARGVVLVTTRDDIVAQRIGAEHMHRVELMSIDVGWELLWKSMNIKEANEVQNLQEIGIEIVHKCGRLPLAIKVIASVLATKEKTEKQWRKILSNNAWSMSKLPPELGGALYLSYSELPPHLKQCFLHLALYPEDCNIYRQYLVNLWIAEGFIEEQQDQLLEDTAEEYYYELINRNLLQPNPVFITHSECKMHDLLRQLACHLSREECFIGDPQSLDLKTMSKIRRVLVDTKKTVVFPNLDKVQYRVRTLMFNVRNSTRIDSTIFVRFPRLRVLDLTKTDVESIPDCIGQLIHLRLLDVNGTNISYLPESISSLTNLQTLNLECCHALYSLPVAITQLCNLRRLGLSNTPINQVPKGIGTLVFLNDLEGFPAGHGYGNTKLQDGWNLEELQPLLQLRQLRMIKLERAVPCGTASLLMDKHHLKALTLRCTERADERCSEDISKIENTFEELVPPHSLEDIFIIGFFGRTYPTWICTCLSSLKYLNLINCIYCVHLPPIGQLPNLEFLRIEGASATTKIGPELLGDGVVYPGSKEAIAFPKLTLLIFEDMHNWEGWSLILEEQEESNEGKEDGSAAKQKGGAQPHPTQLFPHLKELSLYCCPKLRALPPQLAQATSLNRIRIMRASCLKVVENLPFISDALEIKGCGLLERVSNLPQVRELGVYDCPNLRCVEKLANLRQLWLSKDMQEMSPLWVSELHQQCQQHHGEDLDVYTWREEKPNSRQRRYEIVRFWSPFNSALNLPGGLPIL